MMTNQIRYYLIFFAGIVFSEILSGQDLQDSLYDTIPIEAYEGFEQDTFTLPGESKPRQIFKVGVYKSNVKIHLEEVGEVYVHHVLGIHEEGYPYVEVYSRMPSSGFIQGIERYGHYRMFARQAHEAEEMYNGNSRIEFVNGRNTIVHSINPRKAFTINGQKEMSWEEDIGELTRVSFNLRDCRKYVDTILYDSSRYGEFGPGCTFSGFIEYSFYNELIQVNLHAGIGDEEPTGLETFESIIYDTLGQIVLRVSEAGPVNSIYLTANQEYVYMNGGGALSEDFEVPYFFKLVRIKTGEVLLEKRSKEFNHNGWTIAGTNLGIFQVNQLFGHLPYLEAYVIDHDKNLMYLIHHNPLCQPSFSANFFKDYCECRSVNGLKAKLYYDKDFTAVTFIKK